MLAAPPPNTKETSARVRQGRSALLLQVALSILSSARMRHSLQLRLGTGIIARGL